MKIKLPILALACSLGINAYANPEQDGERRGGHNRPDPNEVVIELIADYDVSNDNTLDAAELTNGLQGLHEKRIAEMKERREKRLAENDDEYAGKRSKKGPRNRDHSKAAAKMIEHFDSDGDQALNSEELLSALNKIHGKKGGRKGPRPERDDV